MERPDVFNWKVCGVGGYGLQVASSLLGKTFLRGGFYVHVYDEFPSIIKGGPATSQVAVSEHELRSHRNAIDILVCLTDRSVDDDAALIKPGGWLVYDTDQLKEPPKTRKDVVIFPVPMTTIIREIGAEKIMRNVVSLGVTLELLSYPLEPLQEIIREEYGRKGKEVLEEDYRALEKGAEFTRTNAPKQFVRILKAHRSPRRRMLVPGNDALGLGTLAAGCRFYAGYPMTPSSSILSFMVTHGPANGMVVRQLPDEIAVINAGIGASFAGVRSMVASSGGGFSLMVESVGLAAMTETPIVIVDAQRPGPSTGLPTWTEQGDLRFVMHAGQGDFPRVVLAPGDVEECFRIVPLAFNIADQFQTPVIVLTDKYLGESWFTVGQFTTKGMPIDRGELVKRGSTSGPYNFFPRYADAPSGVSPRPVPGTPGLPFMANSDEHDEYGLSNEEIPIRTIQHHKRLRKLNGIARAMPLPKLYGPNDAALTVVAWGSTKGPILDAIDLLHSEGRKVNLIHSTALSPFPADQFRALFSKTHELVLVEGNATAQFGGLIRQHTGIAIGDQLLRSDGRPFEATELAAALRERLRS